jgi:hypothetical protein
MEPGPGHQLHDLDRLRTNLPALEHRLERPTLLRGLSLPDNLTRVGNASQCYLRVVRPCT